VQDTNDRHAVGARQIENQESLEILDLPFPQASKLRIEQCQARAHLPIFGKIGEGLLYSCQESLGRFLASILGKVDGNAR